MYEFIHITPPRYFSQTTLTGRAEGSRRASINKPSSMQVLQ